MGMDRSEKQQCFIRAAAHLCSLLSLLRCTVSVDGCVFYGEKPYGCYARVVLTVVNFLLTHNALDSIFKLP